MISNIICSAFACTTFYDGQDGEMGVVKQVSEGPTLTYCILLLDYISPPLSSPFTPPLQFMSIDMSIEVSVRDVSR